MIFIRLHHNPLCEIVTHTKLFRPNQSLNKMKNSIAKLVSVCIVLMFLVSACKKDKNDDLQKFTHRIISDKYYYNNLLESETAYEYTGEKLTTITEDPGTDEESEILLSYPNENTIIATGSDIGTVTFTLSNNLVTEIVDANDYKYTTSYNSENQIENTKEYDYDGGWTLSYEQDYTYSSGKLVLRTGIEYGGTEGNWENKYVYTYNGEELIEELHTYKSPGGVWTDCHKYAFTYSNGKISKRTHYYKSETSWVENYYEEFLYDTYGNLIKSFEDGDNSDRMEYTYEEGNGNFRQIFENSEYEFGYPIPNKKSQISVREINDLRSFIKLH